MIHKSSQMLVVRREETGVPGENLSVQSREPTNSTHIWRRIWESNPGHIVGRRVLSPLRHPCIPIKSDRSALISKASYHRSSLGTSQQLTYRDAIRYRSLKYLKCLILLEVHWEILTKGNVVHCLSLARFVHKITERLTWLNKLTTSSQIEDPFK